MRPFVLDDAALKKIADLREMAEANPITLERMTELAARYEAGDTSPSPQMGLQTIDLDHGFAITFTIETTPNNVRIRHFSMSVDDPKRVPHPMAVEMTLPHFGWVGKMTDSHVFTSPLGNGGHCVEVIQPLSGNMNEISQQ